MDESEAPPKTESGLHTATETTILSLKKERRISQLNRELKTSGVKRDLFHGKIITLISQVELMHKKIEYKTAVNYLERVYLNKKAQYNGP
jgi:hypothetical protein